MGADKGEGLSYMSRNFDSQDVEQNKTLGGLGYLVFFVPLLACPTSAFGKHAANQGLLALLVLVVAWFVSGILGWIPVVGAIIRFAMWLVEAAVGLLMLYYTYKAMAQGESSELPVVGSIGLIK